MTDEIAFPSQGELVSYVFNAFGVLPTKHSSDFEEQDKTKFQRLLKRLKDEEGLLVKNFDKSLEVFGERLHQCIENTKIERTVMSVLADLYHSFNRTIINEGTYTTKKDSLLYYLLTRATATLVESVTFQMLTAQLIVDNELISTIELFLPEVGTDGITVSPIAKTIGWVYEEMDCSQIQFHFPGKTAGESDYHMDHNLENAGNWVRGKSLPSLPALITNFRASLNHNREIRGVPEGFERTMKVNLMLARVATFVCRDICKHFGKEALQSAVKEIRRGFKDICVEIDEFKRVTKRTFALTDLSGIDQHEWQRLTSYYQAYFYDKKAISLREISDLGVGIKSQAISGLSAKYGRYAVLSNLHMIKSSEAFQPSLTFSKFLLQGFELKKAANTSLDDVLKFGAELARSPVAGQLPWLTPWLEAVCHYRTGDYEEAWKRSKEAFMAGRYRAGKNQYLLTNQYLELSAKTKRWRAFKSAYDWANYVGIRVRWAGDNQASQEGMESAYAILGMQNLSYPML